MIYKLFTKGSNFVLYAIQFQLILTLASLPILIAWGIPFASLSCLGNIIFSPFLNLFLLISSFIFFCEILCIPNEFLINILDKITKIWCTLISKAPTVSLVGFSQQSSWVLICLPIAGCFFLTRSYVNSVTQRIAICVLLLCFFGCYIYFSKSHVTHVHQINDQNEQLLLVENQNGISLVDNGEIGRHSSIASYVEYTLLPTIIKKTGYLHIHNLILLRPSKRVFDSINHLYQLSSIKNIYLVKWNGTPKLPFLNAFKSLQKNATLHDTKVQYIETTSHSIRLSANNKIVINPINKIISKQSITFMQYQITIIIDNKIISFYDAQ